MLQLNPGQQFCIYITHMCLFYTHLAFILAVIGRPKICQQEAQLRNNLKP